MFFMTEADHAQPLTALTIEYLSWLSFTFVHSCLMQRLTLLTISSKFCWPLTHYVRSWAFLTLYSSNLYRVTWNDNKCTPAIIRNRISNFMFFMTKAEQPQPLTALTIESLSWLSFAFVHSSLTQRLTPLIISRKFCWPLTHHIRSSWAFLIYIATI